MEYHELPPSSSSPDWEDDDRELLEATKALEREEEEKDILIAISEISEVDFETDFSILCDA